MKKALVLFMLAASVTAHAKVQLKNFLGDSMVVQQNSQLVLTGKAVGKVTVQPSWNKEKQSTVAEADSTFSICIATPEAGGPYSISIKDKDGSIKLRDIYSGEVWLCSGQSNMEMPLADWGYVNNYQAEIDTAVNFPTIRLLHVEQRVATESRDDVGVKSGGWRKCSPDAVAHFSSVAYFFARELQKAMPGIPVGVINSSQGATRIEAWSSPEAAAEWQDCFRAADAERHTVSGLYRGMIEPLHTLSLAGILWYQGCDNVDVAAEYEILFPRLIYDWRKLFGKPELPFYFVQLSNFLQPKELQPASKWAALRKAQALTAGLKNTGMATTIDNGDANDIHPKNKQEVARRLALLALHRTYGLDNVCDTAPKPSVSSTGTGTLLTFDEPVAAADTGLQRGFSALLDNGLWVVPEVKRTSDRQFEISHSDGRILLVRYDWADNPDGTLRSTEGFPIAPFSLECVY